MFGVLSSAFAHFRSVFSDVFSGAGFGIIVWELLAWKRPWIEYTSQPNFVDIKFKARLLVEPLRPTIPPDVRFASVFRALALVLSIERWRMRVRGADSGGIGFVAAAHVEQQCRRPTRIFRHCSRTICVLAGA
jgi:hypothetical protein